MKHQFYIALLLLLPLGIKAQWTSQATGFDQKRGLFDISIVNKNVVWGIAYNESGGIDLSVPEFTRTIDGGDSWQTGEFLPGYKWSNIIAVNSLIAWVAVVKAASNSDGAIFKTIDGGLTWNEQGKNEIFNSSSYTNWVYFWSSNTGIAMGDPNPGEFEIYLTSDGGVHWIAVPASNIPDPLIGEIGILRNYTVFGDHIWFSTNKYRVFHSADRGHTWEVGNTGISDSGPSIDIDIVFWNENEGLARKYNYITNLNTMVVKTTDGGKTWNPIIPTGKFYGNRLGGIAYVPGTTSTLVSTCHWFGNYGSSYSNDGGLSWTIIDTILPLYIARFWDNTTGWASSINTDNENGGVYKYEGNLTGIINPQTKKEIICNVGPNPSGGFINIQLFNALEDNVKIAIYDINGILLLNFNTNSSGEFFNQTLDLNRIPRGLYILKIDNGIFHNIQKIVKK